MSRPLRIEFPGAIYRSTSRGDRRQPIFIDDTDRHALLAVVAHTPPTTGCAKATAAAWQIEGYPSRQQHIGLHSKAPAQCGNLSRIAEDGVKRRRGQVLPSASTPRSLRSGGERGQVLPFAPPSRSVSAPAPPTANRIPRIDRPRYFARSPPPGLIQRLLLAGIIWPTWCSGKRPT